MPNTTDRNGDALVGEILDVIDRSDSQRYKTAVALAEHFRGKYISRVRKTTISGSPRITMQTSSEELFKWIDDTGICNFLTVDSDQYKTDLKIRVAQALQQAQQLTDSERYDYERLKQLEQSGLDDYQKMRKAKTLTPDAVLSFINQLSAWNLQTTGKSVLEAYVDNVKQQSDKLPSIHANEVKGVDCPSCGHPTLMLFEGYITCTLADCPNPDYAEAIQQSDDERLAAARKQVAGEIFNLAHRYASEDETMIGSEELRGYHYFNAIHKIGGFDGR